MQGRNWTFVRWPRWWSCIYHKLRQWLRFVVQPFVCFWSRTLYKQEVNLWVMIFFFFFFCTFHLNDAAKHSLARVANAICHKGTVSQSDTSDVVPKEHTSHLNAGKVSRSAKSIICAIDWIHLDSFISDVFLEPSMTLDKQEVNLWLIKNFFFNFRTAIWTLSTSPNPASR